MSHDSNERSRLLQQTRQQGQVNGYGEDGKQEGQHRGLLFKSTAIGACWIGTVLFALDSSIVTTLATSIGSSFGAANLGPALGTTYLGASCAFTPLFGRISDIYGRKAMLLLAGVLFTVATLGCGVSRSIGELLVWRALGGIGGGGLVALSSVVMSDLVSQRRRGLLQGASNVIFAAGSALGGPIGGWLNDTVGWKRAFLYQLPLCGIMLLAIAFRVNIPLPWYDGSLTRRQRLAQVDFAGSACIIFAVAALVTGLQLGGNFMSWSSPIVLALLIIGTLGLAGFLVVEGKVSAVPIISLDVLRTRTVLCAFTANLFGAIVIFASIFQLPLYFLVVKNLSATQAGIHYFPMSVSLAVGSLVVGQIVNRTGRYRVALLFSNLLSLVTPLLVALAWRSDWPDSYWRYFTDLIPLGLGNGGAITIILVATIASVPHSNVATVTSINSFSRVFGQTLGVSISGAIVQSRVRSTLQSALVGRPDADELVKQIRTDIASIPKLPSDVRSIAVAAYQDSLRVLFLFVAACALAALVACLPIPQHELSTKGPLDEEEDE